MKPEQIAALQARIAELEAAVAAKPKGTAPTPTVKTSAKGGVSVYGLGRFPVTLYREQWEKLFDLVPAIKAHIDMHVADLSKKGDKPKPATDAGTPIDMATGKAA